MATPILVVLIADARSAVPPLDGFFPAGATRGTTNTVTAIGKFESWPPRVWVSGAGARFAAETNKGKFSVIIAPDAEPGTRLVRLYNDDGASEPKFFVISSSRELTETEPNNHFGKAQPLSALPVTINGRLEKNGDVDSFAFDMRAGQWLDARVDAYALMSKVDAVLRLVTTNGQQLAWNHDFVTLDPRLIWQSPAEQRVVLQMFGFAYPPGSEIAFTGGEAVTYRLHLSLTNAGLDVCNFRTAIQSNAQAIPQSIELPAEIRRNISRGDEEHRYQFTATKNDFIEAAVQAASFGSRLDAWLKIEDPAGHQLARNDDADGSPDPKLEWKAPTNGIYVLALGSVTHRGGEDFCYRLNVKRAEPDFRALAASSIVLTPGATNELKIDFKRLRGFTNEVVAAVRGLPPGVTFVSTNLPAKDGSAALQLIAATNALPFQGAIQIVVSTPAAREERTVPFELITRGETGFARLLLEADDHLWLTVKPKSDAPGKPSGE